jgi:hypothetical protein
VGALISSGAVPGTDPLEILFLLAVQHVIQPAVRAASAVILL